MGKNSALTKTGIGNTPETATYQDSPQATVAAFGKQSVAPEMQSNTYTPGLQYDDSGNVSSDAGPQPAFIQNRAAVTPKFQHPSFADTEASPDLAKKADTKGGKLLNFFLSVANGGAAGAGQPTFGGGFLMAQHAGMQRQQAANQQKQQQIENQRQQQEETRRQQEADQQNANYKSEDALRQQQIEASKAQVGMKEKTPQEIYAEDIKNGLTPEEAKQHAYKITPHTKNEPNPTEASLALAAASGDEKAIKALGLIKANKEHPKGSRAADHADRQADAEDQAGRLLDAAGGDPNKAMELFNKALATGKVDRYHLSLAPSIRNSIRGGRRVQNTDPFAGLLNNNSPQ